MRAFFVGNERVTTTTKSIWALIAACVTWGFAALYYKLLTHFPPAEVLAHRTLWSFVIFAILVLVTGRSAPLKDSLIRPKHLGLILVAGIMIAINWYVFIFSITAERLSESSLGYYLFPLVLVLLGRVIFAELLSPLKWLAVGLAAISVAGLTFAFGSIPWLALLIAGSFGAYGILKRLIATDPFVSVTLEVALIAPISIWYLWTFGSTPSWGDFGLLVVSGVLTAGPLVLMSYAANNLRTSTVGIVQYLNPILQYFTAVVLLGEGTSVWHLASIALIWLALAIFSFAAFSEDRSAVKTSSTVSHRR